LVANTLYFSFHLRSEKFFKQNISPRTNFTASKIFKNSILFQKFRFKGLLKLIDFFWDRGNSMLFSIKVQHRSAINTWTFLPLYRSTIYKKVWWNRSLYSSDSVDRWFSKKIKGKCKKWILSTYKQLCHQLFQKCPAFSLHTMWKRKSDSCQVRCL